MVTVLINTYTGERYTVLPHSINLLKVMNLETGFAFYWTNFDYEYSIESGHFEFLEGYKMWKPAFIVSVYNAIHEPIYYEFSDEYAAIECARKYRAFGFEVRLFQQIPIA